MTEEQRSATWEHEKPKSPKIESFPSDLTPHPLIPWAFTPQHTPPVSPPPKPPKTELERAREEVAHYKAEMERSAVAHAATALELETLRESLAPVSQAQVGWRRDSPSAPLSTFEAVLGVTPQSAQNARVPSSSTSESKPADRDGGKL